MLKSHPYPPPLTIPSQSTHTQTIILLHGRSSTADKFGPPLLSHPININSIGCGDTLPPASPFQSHFPHARFIIPTSSIRRAASYNRALTHQWFDMYPLDSHPPEYRQHIQLAGLKESVEYVHALLRDAVREVGAGNVVVMGLSQGCAVGLVALLLWDGGRLGAFVGMCGWLPLRREMVDAVGGDESQEEGEEDGGGLFERDEMEVLKDGGKSKLEHAIEWLGGELERSRDATQRCNGAELEKTPVFLGHGHEDEKVPLQLGSLASDCLKELGFDVRWREYPGLAHWYSSDMLHDIVVFLNERKGNSQ